MLDRRCFSLLFVAAAPLLAEEPPAHLPPVVSAAPSTLTVRPNTGPVRFFGPNVFRENPASTKVTLATSLGNVYFELFDQRTPGHAANFLRYLSAGRYNGTFIHRNVAGFIWQGGGFSFDGTNTNMVTAFPAVTNEPGISNRRATLALAKLGGDPNSGTSQFFVNLADNSANLDAQNGGFTVFGRVIGTGADAGMGVVDLIASQPTYDLSGGNPASPFTQVPTVNYSGMGAIGASNLVNVPSVTTGAAVAYSASSANPAIVAASGSGNALTLTFPANSSGTTQVTLRASQLVNTGTDTTFDVQVTPSAPLARLGNIATRARIETGDNVLIGGFVVRGPGSKRVLVRCLGPSLAAAGVTGTLADPAIQIFNGQNQPIASNDNWQDSQAAEIQASGRAPTDPRESAIILTLAPGGYTAVCRGAAGGVGVGLVEVYELDGTETPQLINIASRGKVGTGDDVLIAGNVITTTSPKRVLIRAIGPSLTAAGVAGALANPTLQIFQGGVLIAENDDWQRDSATGGTNPDAAAISATNQAPTNPAEAAVIATLAPGGYTAIVRGVNGTTGVALVEVYDLE